MNIFRIEKKSKLKGIDINMNEYITSDYLYTESGNGDFIYLKKFNTLYIVDHEKKTLISQDMEIKKNQINQIRSILPDFDISFENISETSRMCTIEGRNSDSILKASILIKELNGICNTCHWHYHEYSKTFGILSIDLEGTEIIESMNLHLNIFGNISETKVETMKIEKNQDTKLSKRLNEIQRYVSKDLTHTH